MSEPIQPDTRTHHVRVTRIHATGGHTTRDVDIWDRESWKRLCRGAKETLETGGEHHIRPLYKDDGPAVSMPSHLKLRVEALEEGIRRALEELGQQLDSMKPAERTGAWVAEILEPLLRKKPETENTGA